MNEITKASKWIGTSPVRPDGVPKVTGHARFGDDFHLTGMLQSKVLRSPHAHARIRSIDTSKAEALPGVQCRKMAALREPISTSMTTSSSSVKPACDVAVLACIVPA